MYKETDIFPLGSTVWFIKHYPKYNNYPILYKGVVRNYRFDVKIPKYEVEIVKYYESLWVLQNIVKDYKPEFQDYEFCKKNIKEVKPNYYSFISKYSIINNKFKNLKEGEEFKYDKKDCEVFESVEAYNIALNTYRPRTVVDHQLISRDKQDVIRSLETFNDVAVENLILELFNLLEMKKPKRLINTNQLRYLIY